MKRFSPLATLVALMWLVFIVDSITGLGMNRYGILPRELDGLVGIVFWPILHGNAAHIASNTVSLLLFGGIVSARNANTFLRLTVFVTLVAGFFVWLLGRSAIHIGASGLVFGYFGYIVVRGLYDKSFLSVIISVAVIVAFGSIIWGALPSNSYVSWEGHLFGLLSGSFYATKSRRKGYR